MHVERLSSAHDLTGFSCGNKTLDDWLRLHGWENDRRNLSRTYVLIDEADTVVGYYSLTMGGVRKEQLPKRYGHGLPNYDIGMVLIARLAISEPHQGQGWGRDLMLDAIEQSARAGAHAAARFLAVDPIDEPARAFYRRFGFRNIDGDPGGRMYLRLDEALGLVEQRGERR
ncbi:MAG: GNAT family N-acetyltransferase [Acidimicrobiales bacterium]